MGLRNMQDGNNSDFNKSAWQNVSNIRLQLWREANTKPSDIIYANGLHQVLVIAILNLTDKDGNLLPDDKCPPVQNIKAGCRPINYVNGDPLGDKGSVGWSYEDTKNAFSSPIVENFSPSLVDTKPDYISNGCAYLHYYIQTTSASSAIQIGFEVEIRDDQGIPQKRIKSSLNGEFKAKVDIKSIGQITFQPDDFEWFGAQKYHGGDENDTITPGPMSDNNAWREYEYSISLTEKKFSKESNHIYRACITNLENYTDYSFGTIFSGFYTFKGYFWPFNIFKEQEITKWDAQPIFPTAKQTFTMDISGAPKRTSDITYISGRFSISLLCAFGAEYWFGYIHNTLSILIYDQYGNRGYINIDPKLLPDKYIPSSKDNGLQSLSYFSKGEITEPTKSIARKYVFIKNVNKEYPERACAYQYKPDSIMIWPEKNCSNVELFNLAFNIIINDNSMSGVDYINMSFFSDLDSNLYIDERGYVCSSKGKPGDKFKVAPNWITGSTCISTDSYNSYLALIFDAEGHYYDEIQFIDKYYFNPSTWPIHKPEPISFAGFDWELIPTDDIPYEP